MNQKLFWLFLIFSLGIIFFIGSTFLMKPKTIEVIPPQAQVSKISNNQKLQKENKIVSVILVGDIMLDRGVEYAVKKYGKDFSFPFLKIADYLKEADIVFGNLEGPISDKGIKSGSIYSFRADPKNIEGLTFAGFDILSLANNHVFDYGREALEDTFLRLKAAGINYIGAGFNEKEAFSPVIKEVNGTKIGFLAYTNLGPETWKATEENSGIAWIQKKDFDKVRKDIEASKSQVDVLIVSLHAGEEYQKTLNQFQIDFAKMAIESGADLVVGHHPHVVQPNEKYGNGYIFYSLGNFVFDQDFSKETMKGQMVKVLIENSKIKQVIPNEIKINEYFQPELSDTEFELPKEDNKEDNQSDYSFKIEPISKNLPNQLVNCIYTVSSIPSPSRNYI
jgi:poly-gamma-glutamate synthesis protein (capsule biosynthesis protein)